MAYSMQNAISHLASVTDAVQSLAGYVYAKLPPIKARSLEDFSILWEKYADKSAPVVAKSAVTQDINFFDPFDIYPDRYSTILTARRPDGRGIIFVDYHGRSRPCYLTGTDFFPNYDLKPVLTLVDRVERLERVFPNIQTIVDHDVIKNLIGMFDDEKKARDELKRLAAEKKVIPFL